MKRGCPKSYFSNYLPPPINRGRVEMLPVFGKSHQLLLCFIEEVARSDLRSFGG